MLRLTSIVVFRRALERFVSSIPAATRNWFCHAIASSTDCTSHCPWLVMIGGSLPSQHVSVIATSVAAGRI